MIHKSQHPDEKWKAQTVNLQASLTHLVQAAPEHLDVLAEQADGAVWAEIDCLSCGNCCRTMSPSFTNKDIKRIASHFRLSVAAFKRKWLYQNKKGDWMNRQQSCPFLDLSNNHCSIYAIRPDDCASFPHLTKKPFVAYMHVHRQNLEYCPATVKLVEKLNQRIEEDCII